MVNTKRTQSSKAKPVVSLMARSLAGKAEQKPEERVTRQKATEERAEEKLEGRAEGVWARLRRG
jgi:hypothetical protein